MPENRLNIGSKLYCYLMDEKLEFLKLDNTDRKVIIFYILPHRPNALASYVDYIGRHYARTKGIEINTGQLLKEVLSMNQ